MLNVFRKKSKDKLQVQIFDGRTMLLEDLIRDYERLLKEESSRKVNQSSEHNDDNTIIPGLKIGEWFRIDREVISKKRREIYRQCNEAGTRGEELWKRFEKSNKIADENPKQYPRLIETYIFPHKWECKTEQEMRDMCKEVGDGMCCEVICDLELQMRICIGESVKNLVEESDKLPRVRVIELRNGGSGYFGGGVDDNDHLPPAYFNTAVFFPASKRYDYTPYAFRRVYL